MINFKAAIHTTVLVVNDDVRQLELHALRMELSGFSVITAVGPGEAISIMNEASSHSRCSSDRLSHAGNEWLHSRRIP